MWLDIGQEIQFRVFAVEYGARDAHSKPPTRWNTDQLVAADEKPSASQPPMTITVRQGFFGPFLLYSSFSHFFSFTLLELLLSYWTWVLLIPRVCFSSGHQ